MIPSPGKAFLMFFQKSKSPVAQPRAEGQAPNCLRSPSQWMTLETYIALRTDKLYTCGLRDGTMCQDLDVMCRLL